MKKPKKSAASRPSKDSLDIDSLLDVFRHEHGAVVVNRAGISNELKQVALMPDHNKSTGTILDAVTSGAYEEERDAILSSISSPKAD